jgi:hypothetical protein
MGMGNMVEAIAADLLGRAPHPLADVGNGVRLFGRHHPAGKFRDECMEPLGLALD